jgi:hypothetical protein
VPRWARRITGGPHRGLEWFRMNWNGSSDVLKICQWKQSESKLRMLFFTVTMESMMAAPRQTGGARPRGFA